MVAAAADALGSVLLEPLAAAALGGTVPEAARMAARFLQASAGGSLGTGALRP